MALFAEQKSSRYDRTMAKSQEFNDLILYLCQRAPLEMRGVFKIAFQKCEDALHGEKDTRASRKRAQQSNVDKRDSKRVKITCEIGEETTRQTEVDDEDGLTTEDDLKATWQKGNMTALPTQYEIEAGLEEESPVIVDFVKASLVKFRSPMIHSMSYAQDEINKVWRIIPMLEFYTTRRELSQHLENREKMPGEKLHARTDWNISEPSEILDALDNVKRSTLDNKIHRAYGQMMLFSSVNAEVERGYHSHVTGYRSDHAELLEELAREKAGSVSKTEIDQIITSYAYEYQTGQKWLPVIDWFGGSGIILIFMIAGKFFLLPSIRPF